MKLLKIRQVVLPVIVRLALMSGSVSKLKSLEIMVAQVGLEEAVKPHFLANKTVITLQ